MARLDQCEVCGFAWHTLSSDEVAPRLRTATASWLVALDTDTALLASRPAPERWSGLEYASHVRDVLLSIRERIILACVEDVPVATALYREERVALGLYDHDEIVELRDELLTASRLFVKTFLALADPYADRELIFSKASPTVRRCVGPRPRPCTSASTTSTTCARTCGSSPSGQRRRRAHPSKADRRRWPPRRLMTLRG